jgi:lipopolysaccharide biosynthesis glycosyltransferase
MKNEGFTPSNILKHSPQKPESKYSIKTTNESHEVSGQHQNIKNLRIHHSLINTNMTYNYHDWDERQQ